MTAVWDDTSLRRKHASEVRERAACDVIEDEVVALLALREVLANIIDDVVGPNARTISTFPVLQTPVTSVSKALAI